MDKKQFNKLKTRISDFSKINFFQFSDMNKNQPTGLFCSAFSDISKDFCMQKVKDVIDRLKYPFTVTDEGLSNTHHFVIRFKYE